MSKMNRVFLPFFIASIIVFIGFSPRTIAILPNYKHMDGRFFNSLYGSSFSKSSRIHPMESEISLSNDMGTRVSVGGSDGGTVIGGGRVTSLVNDLFSCREPDGGTRGGFCAIAPKKGRNNSLRTFAPNPVFAWGSDVLAIQVADGATAEPIWPASSISQEQQDDPQLRGTYQLTTEEREQKFVQYRGPDLMPGHQYKLLMYYNTSPEQANASSITIESYDFWRLSSQEIEEIDRQLNALDIIEPVANLTLEQRKAISRSQFFATYSPGLWMDVFREITSVNLPEEGMTAIQLNIEQICE